MAKGKKTSSEDKAKVITAKIKNPDLSLRDIEKQTGVKKSTTKDILDRDLPEVRTSSDKMQKLIERDLELLEIIQNRKTERLNDKNTPVNDKDIDKWENTANKRRLLFDKGDKGDNKTPITIQI